MKKKDHALLINDQIIASKVQVISADGENLGEMPTSKALQLAQSLSLDLVMLNDKETIPLVKVMDFGKSLYEKKKKFSEGKKKQKVIKVKEIKMRPKIGEHDYQTKLNQGIKFLQEGNKLKVTLMFRGREAHSKEERGAAMFLRVDETLGKADLGSVAHENDAKAGPFWSRIYYIKAKK